MKKILIYNSGGGLGDSIQLIPLILSLQNHYKRCKFFYLGAHQNHFHDKLKEYDIKIETLQLDLNDVKFLLNPYNFTAKISTNNPTIILGSNKFQIKSVKTNIFLKSLINNDFLIDDLEISTEQIKLNDLILFI